MENNEHEHNKECCNNHHGMWHKHHVLRWLLGILILFITFVVGFKLGEFKGYFDNDSFGRGYGRGMMGGTSRYYDTGFSRPGMMYGRTTNSGNLFYDSQNLPPMMQIQTLPSTSTTVK